MVWWKSNLYRTLRDSHALFRPSWMGTWGSPSPKPSRCWGTVLGAKGCSVEASQKFSEQCVPRSWLPSLYRTLTKLQRKKLAERAKKLKITIKRRKADGSMSVPIPQFVGHIDHHLSRVTRSIKRAHVSVSGVVAQTFVLRRFIHVDLARGCALFMSSLWTLGDGLCQTESPECWFISKLILSYLWPRFDQMYVLPKTSRLTGPTKTLQGYPLLHLK